MITIDLKQPEHEDVIKNDIVSVFGSANLISANREYRNAHLPDGFVALEEGELTGILLYVIKSGQCELVYLHSLRQGRGIAKALIKRLINHIREIKVRRLVVLLLRMT